MIKPISYPKILIRSSLYTGMAVILFMLLNTWISGDAWEGMTLSKSSINAEYCELNNTTSFFHQKMNTYSNLAYFFIGVFILQLSLYDKANQNDTSLNKLQRFPALSMFMGFCFVYLCIGSAFFHASLTLLGQRVDMNGTYSISIALLGVSMYHFIPEKFASSTFKVLYICFLAVALLLFFSLALRVSSGKLIPILVLSLTTLKLIYFFLHRKERYFFLIILSFGFLYYAIQIRTMDVQKVNCDPLSWYQGHSLWHVLTAISSFVSYAFFRFRK
jgi:hypothetical protein